MDIHLLRRLFASLDAFGRPFTSALPARLLLCRTDGCMLRRDQFEALAAAAASVGDTDATAIETEDLNLDQPPAVLEQVRFSLGSYARYRQYRNDGHFLVENAIVPDTGRWAVLISQEWHALLGGQPEFVREFTRHYPPAAEDLRTFVTEWEGNASRIGSDISWLPGLLEHVRGAVPP